MQESIENSQSDLEKRAKNAFNICVSTGVIFILIAASAMFVSRSIQLGLSLYLILLTIAAAFVGAWLSRRGKSDLGVLLVIAALLVTIFGRVFVQQGLSIPNGVTNIVLISAIAVYALSPKWIGRVIALSFLATIVTVIIDQYTTNRIPAVSSSETGMTTALILGAIYLAIVASRFSKFNLRTKLIVGFLFLSATPLIMLGWQTYITSKTILQDQAKASLRASAASTSGSLADFINEQSEILTTEASLADIINYVSMPASQRKNSDHEQHALNALQTFTKKDAEDIISYALLDANGRNLLDTVPSNINSSDQNQVFFTEPLNAKKPYLSNVLFPRKFSSPIIYFAVPIFDAKQQVIGVLLATYKANVLQSVLQAAAQSRSSKTEYTFLIDSAYFINLGHSSKPDLLYKSYMNIDDAALLDLQGKNILRVGNQNALLAPQPEVVSALRGMELQKSFQAPSLENNGQLAESAAVRVTGTNWIVVASQPISAIAALTQNQTRVTVTSSAIILMIAAIIALFVSNFFTNPIIQLTEAAEKISAGDFKQKALIKSNDEIGVLGKTFNSMADEIQELIASLEDRVAQSTSEMEKATAQSEKRASELQTIAEIARYISAEKNLEGLLPLIARAVSERFGFYHVGIFLLNENKNFAVLRAANSVGGQAMLKREHKLEVGQTGIVGNVTATGAPRIALDTGADAAYFNNPDLPETHSEMALPLSARGEVIGALDVQSTESNAFTTSDISVLSLLADQIAIAIDNARLLEESKKALAQSQSVFSEYIAEAWQSKAASNVLGYHQTAMGGKVITRKSAPETDLLLEDGKNTLAVPIQLRGQTIGALNIRVNKDNEALSMEQVNIIESVTERLGLALENARLFEETSSRASRERLVTDITAKIRGTNDPQEMIQTAVEELKRALGASRIEIIPKKTAPQKDEPTS